MEHDLKCQQCGKHFIGKRADAKYCSNTCRTYACRDGKAVVKKVRKGKSSLSGISNFLAPQPAEKAEVVKQIEKSFAKSFALPVPQPEKETITFKMMPPVRGYVENPSKGNHDVPALPDPPAPFTDERPMEIQKQMVSYALDVPNPEYKRLFDGKQQQLKAIEAQRNLVTQHEELLKQIKESTNLSALHYIIAATGGGAIGNRLAENKVGGTLLGLLLGVVAMRIIQQGREESFKREKAEAIRVQTENVKKCREYLDTYLDGLELLNSMLAKQSEILSQRGSRVGNMDAILKREQEIRIYENKKNEAHEESKAYGELVADHKKKYGNIFEQGKDQTEEMPKAQVENSGVVSSVGLRKVVGGKFLFQGKWLGFFGQPSRDFQMLIRGESGSGKSHMALNFAFYLAIHHGTVLYNSSEEGFSVTMNEKVEKLEARVEGLDIGNLKTFEDFKEKIPVTTYNFIVIDSVNDMSMDNKLFKQFTDYYSCSAIIGICQNIKGGAMRGSSNLTYDTDIQIRVVDGIAFTDKNRFINNKPELDIHNIGEVPPVAKAPKHEQTKIIKLIPDVPTDNESQNDNSEKDRPDSNKNDDDYSGDSGFDIDALDHII
ncbi:MAG: ATP-binding protein [Bacteroidia bacterium]